MLAASIPAQASAQSPSTHRVPTAPIAHSLAIKGFVGVPTFTGCVAFRVVQYLSAWGYVHVGYTQINVGVCYNNNIPTIIWGPYCYSGWYVPFIRMNVNPATCTSWGSGMNMEVYGAWIGQIWIPVIGWTGDRWFTQSYGL